MIAGHGRLLAAKVLTLNEIPVIEIAGLSETQIRALRIADNKITLNARCDLKILQQELRELAAIDVGTDSALTGFSIGEIDVIREGNASIATE